MKRTIIVFALSLFFLSFTSHTILAKETPVPSPEVQASASPTATPVNYLLPYPGILPDNALYPLKMLRDKIMDIFTTDPVHKTDFLILMADKRLAAGKALIEGNKIDLGQTTLFKGENYLSRAVDESALAIKQGKNINGTLDNLKNSSQKHIEILNGLLMKVPDQAKPGIQKAY